MVSLSGWSRDQRVIHWKERPEVVGESAIRGESLGTITALPVLGISCFQSHNTISVDHLPLLRFPAVKFIKDVKYPR